MSDQRVYMYRAVIEDPTTLPAPADGTFAPWYGSQFGGQFVNLQDPVTGLFVQNTPVTSGNSPEEDDTKTGLTVFANIFGFDPINGQYRAVPVADGQADMEVVGFGLRTASIAYALDQAELTYRRVNSTFLDQEDIDATAAVGLMSASVLYAVNGTDGLDRVRTGAAANLSAATQPQTLMTTRPGDWTLTHAPAANTIASATKAAGGAGVRHVLTSLDCQIVNIVSVALTAVRCVVRNGATGAGPIIWEHIFSQVSATVPPSPLMLGGLNIVGSENTAMTVEFTTAPGASNFEFVNASGYSVV